MGCAPSADARKEEALEAAERIHDDVAEADAAHAEGRTAEAIRIVEATRTRNVALLIGPLVPAQTARLSCKLGDLRFLCKDYRVALREYQHAARVALEQARESREGSYLMVMRYAEGSVGCARCHIGLLGEAQTRVEQAAQELGEQKSRGLTRLVSSVGQSPFTATVNTMEDSLDPTNDATANPLAAAQAAPDEPVLRLAVSDVDFSDDESNLGISLPDEPGHLTVEQRLLLCEKEVRRRLAVTERRLVECVQCIDECHSHRSEMLIEPLTLLAELYEQLAMWDVAQRTVRKLSGVFMVKYGHSHPAYRRTYLWLNRLADESEARAAVKAVTQIVSTWKMRKAIVALAHRLGRDAGGANAEASSSSSSEGDDDAHGTESDVFNAHASLGRALSSSGSAASGARAKASAGPDFLDVFSRATNAQDENDGDALLRRQLEAVPKGPSSKGKWIEAPSPVAAEPDPPFAPQRSRRAAAKAQSQSAFDVVAVAPSAAEDSHGEPAAATTPLRPTKAAARARMNGRVVASLVFSMSPRSAAGAPDVDAPAPRLSSSGKTAGTPTASPVAVNRSRPIGLWEVS